MSKLDSKIGPKIKAFRRQMGMQANKLAEELNISPSYLNLIEKGRENNVPMDMANIAEQNMIEAMNKGWGKKNAGIIRKLIANKAGIDFDYCPGGFA